MDDDVKISPFPDADCFAQGLTDYASFRCREMIVSGIGHPITIDLINFQPLVISFTENVTGVYVKSAVQKWMLSPIHSVSTVRISDCGQWSNYLSSGMNMTMHECFPNASLFVTCDTGSITFEVVNTFNNGIIFLPDKIPFLIRNAANILTLKFCEETSYRFQKTEWIQVFSILGNCVSLESLDIWFSTIALENGIEIFYRWLKQTKTLKELQVQECMHSKEDGGNVLSEIVLAVAENHEIPLNSLALFGDFMSFRPLASLFNRRGHVRRFEFGFNTWTDFALFAQVLGRTNQYTMLTSKAGWKSLELFKTHSNPLILPDSWWYTAANQDFRQDWICNALQANVNWIAVYVVLASLRSHPLFGLSILPLLRPIYSLIGNPIEFLFLFIPVNHRRTPFVPSFSLSKFTESKFALSIVGGHVEKGEKGSGNKRKRI
jgi:hypothetical protein